MKEGIVESKQGCSVMCVWKMFRQAQANSWLNCLPNDKEHENFQKFIYCSKILCNSLKNRFQFKQINKLHKASLEGR